MKMPLRYGEERVYNGIALFWRERGMSPTLSELGDLVGSKSKAWLQSKIMRLVKKGYITRMVVNGRMLPRSIFVCPPVGVGHTYPWSQGKEANSSHSTGVTTRGERPLGGFPPASHTDEMSRIKEEVPPSWKALPLSEL